MASAAARRVVPMSPWWTIVVPLSLSFPRPVRHWARLACRVRPVEVGNVDGGGGEYWPEPTGFHLEAPTLCRAGLLRDQWTVTMRLERQVPRHTKHRAVSGEQAARHRGSTRPMVAGNGLPVPSIALLEPDEPFGLWIQWRARETAIGERG